MSHWLTYEQVMEAYGLEPAEVRRLVRQRSVITRREGQTQLFEVGGLEETVAVKVEDVLGGWLSYSDLLNRHGVKRGWLDALVNVKIVQYKHRGGQQVYDVREILKCLKKDPDQERTRKCQWGG